MFVPLVCLFVRTYHDGLGDLSHVDAPYEEIRGATQCPDARAERRDGHGPTLLGSSIAWIDTGRYRDQTHGREDRQHHPPRKSHRRAVLRVDLDLETARPRRHGRR